MRMGKLLAVAATFALAACGGGAGNGSAGANDAEPANQAAEARSNIAETLGGSVDHTAFVQALQTAGLIETLRGVGPYTVFAPTNASFDAIPEDARSRLTSTSERDRLIALLSFHIVPGTVTAEDLARAVERGEGGRAELATVTGDNLSLSREGEAIIVADGAGGRARIVRPDQIRSNGVVHSIDAVLMPAGE